MQNVQKQINLFWYLLILCLILLPQPAYAGPDDNPFEVTIAMATPLCEKKEATCKIWIKGVIEGMELSYKLLSSPEQISSRPRIFCFPDDGSEIDLIYKGLMDQARAQDVKDIQEESAVLVLLTPGLSKYMCQRH